MPGFKRTRGEVEAPDRAESEEPSGGRGCCCQALDGSLPGDEYREMAKTRQMTAKGPCAGDQETSRLDENDDTTARSAITAGPRVWESAVCNREREDPWMQGSVAQ